MILWNMLLAKLTNKLVRNWAPMHPTCSQPMTSTTRLLIKRTYSSAMNGDQDDPNIPVDPDAAEITIYHDTPVERYQIPDVLPDLPIIAINRQPFFPGFVKKIDLKQSPKLINLIATLYRDQRKPYVGVFLKRDNENKSETVSSISELYNVGAFAHISDRRPENPDGKFLEMIVHSHRRIIIQEKLDPPSFATDVNVATNKMNGRKAKNKQFTRKMMTPEMIKTTAANEENSAEEKPLIYARTANYDTDLKVEMTADIKTKMGSIVSTVRDIVGMSNLIATHIVLLMQPEQNFADNPIQLCNFVGMISQNAEPEDLQKLMEERNIIERLDLAHEILEKELAKARTMRDIRASVEKKVHEQHHKFMLNEQLKAIKKELGIEKEDKQAVLEKLDERLKELKVPEYAMKVIKEEQAKLSFLDPHSSEFSISRNYLDWLTNIPWGKTSEEMKDVHWARKVLDEDHYGMKDVKERILEFIAVGILKQQTNGKILCFYGPPGVGKTSIAKSIARALNRQYYRFSVGGMTDVAEIKGHRRTYIGAMPGKLIQCLKKVQTENPLILIDEVDKIGGAGYHGDPASALLEVLDPEQNSNFADHFIDVPVDLSKVLFICTANVIDRIPGPLKDRMEMIEVSGYVAEEKMEIAKKYLIPRCQEKCALMDDKLVVKDDAIDALIKSYCRESGVRNLEKHLEKIYRKAALRLVSDEVKEPPLVVSSEQLKDFVGREKFTSDRLYETTPPGVIMGLAWTAMGGSALYIEATLARKFRPFGAQRLEEPVQQTNAQQQPPAGGSLEVTGHLGDVMKESMRTAYTVAKNVLMRNDPENEFLEQAHIHVHVPEGAVPKDGPSAGSTVVSALLSLALGQPAVQGIAMTGEISLTGKVLPIGGVKEKLIAAKRAGVNRVILPEENKKDFDDLDEFIRQDITVHFVSEYDQIFQLLFPDFKPKSG